MKLAPRVVSRWLSVQPYVLPVLILIATWLPACDRGWPRTDSHRYAALSLMAYRQGPFWAPPLGDQPYFNKPPLAFWIEGVLLRVTGPQMWAIRLPTLVCGLAILMLVVDLVRRGSGARAATLSGIVLATTLEFFRYTRAISLDLWMTLWVVGLVWVVARGVRTGKGRSVLWGGLFVGAALMTKPFVVFLALALIAVWLAWEGRWRLIGWLAGAGLIGVLLALPWHVAMAVRFGDEFLRTYFYSDTLRTAVGTTSVNNPWWYPTAFVGSTYLPWILTFLLGIEAYVRLRFRARDRMLVRLAIVWAAGWIVAVSVFGDKRSRYLIPMYPLIAPVSGLWLARVFPARFRRAGRGRVSLVGPVAVVLAAAANLLPASVLNLIHEPRNPKWDDVVASMRAHDADEIWVTLDANTNSSSLYLMTGRYPHLLGPTPEGHGTPAPAGALVLGFKRDLPALEPFGEVVLHTDNLYVVHLTKDWQGDSVLPEGGGDEDSE